MRTPTGIAPGQGRPCPRLLAQRQPLVNDAAWNGDCASCVEIVGDFHVRGGIKTEVRVTYGKRPEI